MTQPSATPSSDQHYEFGKNWQEFIETSFDPERVATAREKLLRLLNLSDLRGRTFLDIGSGSGLHSLAAWMSGAERVTSFDYDPDSVATTRKLHALAGSPENWTVSRGDILSTEYLSTIVPHDIVYSWGVLHHTGSMWEAIRNASRLVTERGLFCIALYTTDMYINPSVEHWLKVKQRYNRAGRWRRGAMEWWHLLRYQVWPDLRSRQNPLARYREYHKLRGMSLWTDIRDWLGGWPMEFAGVMETRAFCRNELSLELLWMNAGEANTEYLFVRSSNQEAVASRFQGVESHLLSPPYEKIGRCGYIARIPELRQEAESHQQARRSGRVLYENGEPLTLPHSMRSDVESHGAGRYQHWKDRLYFSTVDGSDPNTNGRQYSLRKRPTLAIPAAARELSSLHSPQPGNRPAAT